MITMGMMMAGTGRHYNAIDDPDAGPCDVIVLTTCALHLFPIWR